MLPWEQLQTQTQLISTLTPTLFITAFNENKMGVDVDFISSSLLHRVDTVVM